MPVGFVFFGLVWMPLDEGVERDGQQKSFSAAGFGLFEIAGWGLADFPVRESAPVPFLEGGMEALEDAPPEEGFFLDGIGAGESEVDVLDSTPGGGGVFGCDFGLELLPFFFFVWLLGVEPTQEPLGLTNKFVGIQRGCLDGVQVKAFGCAHDFFFLSEDLLAGDSGVSFLSSGLFSGSFKLFSKLWITAWRFFRRDSVSSLKRVTVAPKVFSWAFLSRGL